MEKPTDLLSAWRIAHAMQELAGKSDKWEQQQLEYAEKLTARSGNSDIERKLLNRITLSFEPIFRVLVDELSSRKAVAYGQPSILIGPPIGGEHIEIPSHYWAEPFEYHAGVSAKKSSNTFVSWPEEASRIFRDIRVFWPKKDSISNESEKPVRRHEPTIETDKRCKLKWKEIISLFIRDSLGKDCSPKNLTQFLAAISAASIKVQDRAPSDDVIIKHFKKRYPNFLNKIRHGGENNNFDEHEYQWEQFLEGFMFYVDDKGLPSSKERLLEVIEMVRFSSGVMNVSSRELEEYLYDDHKELWNAIVRQKKL
jgi:hypothetical protein